jgi:polyisoprenoid-binding protein YceI
MKKALIPALLAIVSMPSFATDTYTIDPAHTFAHFEVDHLGFSTHRGRFNTTTGKLTLDIAKKTGSVEVDIDAASIDTGFAKLEEHLRGEDFLDVKKFPTLSFKSSKFEFKNEVLTSVAGELTLHGVTKPVTLTVTHFKCAVHPMFKKDVCGAAASTSIKRTEFGVSKYAPVLGDEVKILLQVEAGKDVAK